MKPETKKKKKNQKTRKTSKKKGNKERRCFIQNIICSSHLRQLVVSKRCLEVLHARHSKHVNTKHRVEGVEVGGRRRRIVFRHTRMLVLLRQIGVGCQVDGLIVIIIVIFDQISLSAVFLIYASQKGGERTRRRRCEGAYLTGRSASGGATPCSIPHCC